MSHKFHLKERDTLPMLRVRLKNPDDSPHDLTGATSVTLHIRLATTGNVLSRPMVIDDVLGGIVSYQWIVDDWTSSTPPILAIGKHEMEYEVVGPGGARLTFPNASYDTLSIVDDLGQQT